MERYVISTPRIRPGNKAAFEAEISHQMDIEQASIASLIESEATRRELLLLQEMNDFLLQNDKSSSDDRDYLVDSGKWLKFMGQHLAKQQGDKDE